MKTVYFIVFLAFWSSILMAMMRVVGCTDMGWLFVWSPLLTVFGALVAWVALCLIIVALEKKQDDHDRA